MKVGVLGCKGTTLDIIHNIRMRGEIVISQVVTLPQEIAEKNNVAYFMGDRIKDYCGGAGIPIYETSSYTLQHEADRAFFRSAGLDLLLVIGWERLLPEQILEQLGRFACGMHGSAYGLPKGRGRSPLNWSLITGHQKFITYLFRYSPGMDDGDLIGFKVFDINEFDDIGVLHAKN